MTFNFDFQSRSGDHFYKSLHSPLTDRGVIGGNTSTYHSMSEPISIAVKHWCFETPLFVNYS